MLSITETLGGVMTVLLIPEDRAAFKRCRRAWDFEVPWRRNLEPVADRDWLDNDRAIRDALAVYYFPGMWDWSRAVVLPLVAQALDKALARQDGTALRRLLGGYLDWAPAVERLSPILVEVDYEVDITEPSRRDQALLTRAGENVRYRGRVDLLAVDKFDAYWIVRHQVVDRWTPMEMLIRDEELVTACWAWEQFYLGTSIAGTIHNELRIPADFEPDAAQVTTPSAASHQRGIPHSDASGGGRSIPQHRRLYAQANEPAQPERVTRDLGPWFRRTWIRRDRAEIDRAGRQLAMEARHILDPDVTVYPSPSEAACCRCSFVAPCQALYEGEDAEAVLATSYRPRPPDAPVQGRLGGATWSTGRGAAPPPFS